MHADPLANRIIGVEQRDGPDRKRLILTVLETYPMFKLKQTTPGHGLSPGYHGGLGIVGMRGRGPAVALVVGIGLSGESGPAGLFTFHFAPCVVGPQNTLHGINGSLKPLFTGSQVFFGYFLLVNIHHRSDHTLIRAIRSETRICLVNNPAVEAVVVA